MPKKHVIQNPLVAIKHFFAETVWELDLESLPLFKRAGLYFARLIYLVSRGFVKNQNFIRATALSYTFLISLVPLLAVIFILYKAVGGIGRLREQLHPLLQHFFNIPADSELYTNLWNFVDGINIGAIGLTGSILLVIAAISLFVMMEKSFNEVWGVQRGRSWTKRFGAYWSLMTLGPILLAVSVWLPAPWALLIIFITFLYQFIPYTRVRFRSALMGGVVAGGLLEAARYIFSWYTATFIGYQKVYGSLAAIPLFFIWVEIGWILILIGAEIAYADQNMKRYRDEQLAEGISIGQRETIAIRLSMKVAYRFIHNQEPPSAEELSESLFIPLRLVRELLYHLVRANIIVELGSTPRRYHPSRPPEEMLLDEVVIAYRMVGTKKLHMKQTKIGRIVGTQLELAHEAGAKHLQINLAKLLA